ncbi:MAG TPA: hypothetical protein VI251_20195, partial [Pseudolabrys sp.]
HLRLNTSPDVAIARRPWMRNWQNLMPLPRFEAALSLLLQEKLLSPTEGDDGGKWYVAASELHDAAKHLSMRLAAAGRRARERGR